MPDHRLIQRNGDSSSNPSVHNIEEAVKRLRIQADGKEDGTVAGSYPGRPSEPDCIFYVRTGKCGYGSNCRFNHPTTIGQANQHGGKLPERVGEPDCVYFLKTGTCKYGSTCKYNHPHERHVAGPIMLNMVGLPMRQEEKACTHYIRTGSCKFGVSCKFNHPQPSVNGGVIPYASTLVPSSGIAAWSLPRPSYGSDPQTYLPVLLPPSQGIGPTQGWSTYMGIMSPVTPAGFFSNLPERPGEPECRYFMNTGNCKYGSDCKFHHPKEKTTQTVASSLGPLGLPLRPGHLVCSYYSLYGTCKFGPTCKYDHPLVGYSYNYGMSLSSMPVIDSSMFPYGGTQTHHSSVLYPSKLSKNADGATTPGGDSHSRSPSPQHENEHEHKHEHENGASPSHSESI